MAKQKTPMPGQIWKNKGTGDRVVITCVSEETVDFVTSGMVVGWTGRNAFGVNYQPTGEEYDLDPMIRKLRGINEEV